MSKTEGGKHLAFKTRCDSKVADAALRVGVESRRSFARWMVFLMLLIVFYFGRAGPVQRKPQQPSPSNFFRVSVERPTPRSKRSPSSTCYRHHHRRHAHNQHNRRHHGDHRHAIRSYLGSSQFASSKSNSSSCMIRDRIRSL